MSDFASAEGEPSAVPHESGSGRSFPNALQDALQNASRPFVPHLGDTCNLPSPGLRVSQLDDMIAFPLSPSQAEQIASLATPCPHGKGLETVVDADVRDCLQIEPFALTFANPQWQPEINKLKTSVAEAFGVPADAVGVSLYKLLLYRAGGHFKAHRDTEKERGMFATLSVQLPSFFEGGQLVVTHKGKSVMYHGGVLDRSCEYTTHYTAFFADLEHEIRPVTRGYRIALVYNLIWLRNGCAPSATCSSMNAVGHALLDHAEQFPSQAWHVAFGLEHKYTDASLSTLGVGALKGADRRNVAAICAASKEAGMGEVKVILCKLSRKDEESGEGWDGDFDMMDSERGTVQIDTQYNEDGTPRKNSLDFVDWESVLSDDDFDVTRKGTVMYTGNEGATRETTYGALAVALWPKNKDLEVMYSGTDDISSLFRVTSTCIIQERINRLLAHTEALGASHRNAWRHTRRILDAAMRHGEISQVNRAIKFASILPDTPYIGTDIGLLISLRGWRSCEQIVRDFLCDVNVSKLKSCKSRISVLFNVMMNYDVSWKLCEESLKIVLAFLERRNTLNANTEKHAASDVNSTASQWSMLLHVFEKFSGLASSEEETASTKIVLQRLAVVIGELVDNDLKELEQELKINDGYESAQWFAPVKAAISSKRRQLSVDEFVEEANFLIKNKELRHPFHDREWMYWQISEELEGPRFVKLACSVFSTGAVDGAIQAKLDSVVKVIPSLPRHDMQTLIRDANNALSSGMHKPTAVLIKQAAERAELSCEEACLRSQIADLEKATAVKPVNVKVRYPGSYGMIQVDTFMAGDKMDTAIGGFGSVVVARKVLKGFQNKLPEGMEAAASGIGHRSYISLRKPFSGERQAWLDYRRKLIELGRARKQLVLIQEKRCKVEPAPSQGSAKRLKVGVPGPKAGGEAKTEVLMDCKAKTENEIESITID